MVDLIGSLSDGFTILYFKVVICQEIILKENDSELVLHIVCEICEY